MKITNRETAWLVETWESLAEFHAKRRESLGNSKRRGDLLLTRVAALVECYLGNNGKDVPLSVRVGMPGQSEESVWKQDEAERVRARPKPKTRGKV